MLLGGGGGGNQGTYNLIISTILVFTAKKLKMKLTKKKWSGFGVHLGRGRVKKKRESKLSQWKVDHPLHEKDRADMTALDLFSPQFKKNWIA